MTVLASLQQPKSKVVSNYHLNISNYTPFDISTFINKKYNNCMILLDEGYIYLDSRMSMSEKNRLMSYVLFQSRKKNVDIYITLQIYGSIEKRFRELTDYIINCKTVIGGFKYTIFKPNVPFQTKSVFLPFYRAYPFMKLYDTNEIVEEEEFSNGMFLTKDQQNQYVEKISDEINTAYLEQFKNNPNNHTKDGKLKTVKKITLSFIRNYANEHNIDKKYVRRIYDKINVGLI